MLHVMFDFIKKIYIYITGFILDLSCLNKGKNSVISKFQMPVETLTEL